MAQGNLLEISYERVIGKVELTISNCRDYDYEYATKVIDGKQYTIFYPRATSQDNYIKDEDGLPTNKIDEYKTYQHIAPPCSSFKISYADVDKEGSGRNSLTGEMFRERVGNYCMIDLTWDLIPNTIEYNNWYKALIHLPSKFKCKVLMPTGETVYKYFYRSDISTSLYMFVENRQIWQGLSTSFIEWNVQPYDDNYEPDMEVVKPNENTNYVKMVKVSKDGITKSIEEHNLSKYLKLEWTLVG